MPPPVERCRPGRENEGSQSPDIFYELSLFAKVSLLRYPDTTCPERLEKDLCGNRVGAFLITDA